MSSSHLATGSASCASRFPALRCVALLAGLTLLPSLAWAQASIVGVVRDSSGGVLPGVVVEAASPVLIEKVRSVVTDGTGQYRIVDLRPGTYTVTFTLSGFNTLVREGIELTGSFVATVGADLRVGALAETIVVSGQSPTVDVQSSQSVRTLDAEVLNAIPSARGYQSFTVLQPGLNVQGADVGGSTGALFSVFQAHGGRRNEGQVQVNGLSAGWQGMGVSGYAPEVGSAQEVSFQVTGGLGEAATGGPQMNLVPRTGGNTLSGLFFGSWAGEAWQGSNLSDEHRAAGLREIGKIEKLWDVNAALGGPIVEDRLWFFWTGRHTGSRNKVAGIFINKAAGDVNRWDYDPDFSKQAVDDNTTKNSSLRLTYQATPRNKFGIWWDEQKTCQSCVGGGALASAALTAGAQSVEADGSNHNPIRMAQAEWQSPVTSRLLLEGFFGLGPNAWFGSKERPEGWNQDLIPVSDAGGIIPGLSYRSYNNAWNYGYMRTYRGSLSYITGAHRFKVGAQRQRAEAAFITHYNRHRLNYAFANGVPTGLTMYANHAARNPFEMYTTAFYVQDVWTTGRLTVQGGLRFERITSFYPEARFGADLFRPTDLTFPAQDAGVGPKDIDPRVGAAYDVFGNGRTALKFSLGRYPTSENSYGAYGWQQQPAFRVSTNTTRSWTDGNSNFRPDCDLLNPASQDNRASGGDLCGPWANQNFGREVVFQTFDPNVLSGWNVREYSWDMSVGLQQELAPRVSVEITYVRRSWGNQTVTDNRAVSAADFDRFNLTAPTDSRLPGGGGYQVTGLFEVKPEKFGQVDNFVTHGKNFGGIDETYNGVDVAVNARTQFGLFMQGGFNIGQSARNNCDVWTQVPESIGFFRTPLQFCDQASGYLTTVSGLAAYTVPRIDVLVSGTLQSRPFAGGNFPSIGAQSLAANTLVFNSSITPALGRPLSGGSALAFVNFVEPGTFYGDRITQVDLRISKILRFGNTRTNVGIDLFNLFNTNAIFNYNQTYNPFASQQWLQPNALVTPRFAKLSVQVDW